VSAADAGGRGEPDIEALRALLDADIECADGVAALIVAAVNALPSLLASLAAARAERDAARDALIHLRYCARQAPYMAPEQNPGELLRDALRRADAALAPRASEPAAGGGK
jgi:hypothetical protein